MKIRFLGAVKGVTGSNHLIEAGGKNIMLDCGMYQGKDEDLNEKDFVINPAEIDCLLLSHSHICAKPPVAVSGPHYLITWRQGNATR